MPWCARGCGPLELHDDPAALAIEVVGEAADGAQAVEQTRRLQPDVVLLDLVMPVLGGIEAIPKLPLEKQPPLAVIILTSFGEEDKLLPAIRRRQGLPPERHPSERAGPGCAGRLPWQGAVAPRHRPDADDSGRDAEPSPVSAPPAAPVAAYPDELTERRVSRFCI